MTNNVYAMYWFSAFMKKCLKCFNELEDQDKEHLNQQSLTFVSR